MKTSTLTTPLLLMTGCLMGCSTVPATYKPSTLGPSREAITDRGLRITIEPKVQVALRGQPLVFDVTITNVGHEPFLLPAEPEVLFVWTYSNGERDNYLLDQPASRYFRPHEVVRMKPGAELVRQFSVKTYYFDKLGITEFRAILEGVPNTNPALETVWAGRAISNAYGVRVDGSRRYASLSGGNPLGRSAR